MPELSEVRRYAELSVRVGLVRSEGGDYVPACAECVEYLDGLLGDGRDGVFCFIAFMCLMRDLLDDSSIDTNMNINYAEMILKHVLDEHEGAAEAVNTLYEEIADRINAEGPKRAREVCEAVINGDLIILRNLEYLRHCFLPPHYLTLPLHHSCPRLLSRTSLIVSFYLDQCSHRKHRRQY